MVLSLPLTDTHHIEVITMKPCIHITPLSTMREPSCHRLYVAAVVSGWARQVDTLTDLHHVLVGGQDGVKGQPSVNRQLGKGVAFLDGVFVETNRVNCSGMQHDEAFMTRRSRCCCRLWCSPGVHMACGFGCQPNPGRAVGWHVHAEWRGCGTQRVSPLTG